MNAPVLAAPARPFEFTLDGDRVATEPPEARGVPRDHVRLLVSEGLAPPVHARFDELPRFLSPGDLLVVNTSATVPAAVDVLDRAGASFVLHVSTELPGGLWAVEPRRRLDSGSTQPLAMSEPAVVRMSDGTAVSLLRPLPGSHRLWLAVVDDGLDLRERLHALGRVIRYSYVDHDWPLACYQTVFAREPGSAEMPSAARPFTAALVTDLVTHGVAVAPITLHTGVSSLEGGELPYPERYRVPDATAALVNAIHDAGGRVIAVGTTVVRALESAVDGQGHVHAAEGWTDVVITPERGVRAVDGLVTGWHEPHATHLAMLEAVAGIDALTIAYDAAYADHYRWHEFGDSHLLLPYAARR